MPGEPTYRKQRRADGSDLAFVEIEGRRYYVGAYGFDESRTQYHRLLARWRTTSSGPRVDGSWNFSRPSFAGRRTPS